MWEYGMDSRRNGDFSSLHDISSVVGVRRYPVHLLYPLLYILLFSIGSLVEDSISAEHRSKAVFPFSSGNHDLCEY
ncbi:hypothetical protein EJ04DRAFT_182976 [Polyplosphaeria fusca]|uniref:Uncharacterized protein n=1 Tax=Polyplosphaeria fusca TaxID=682080 RepID=A0A9P4R316_9PLEO|nr:hypothetical protein EJ04DRAFT_182976 [Polyplosphaeria fusca]